MYISMNWIGDFVDLSGLDLESLIHRFTLSTAEVEDIFHKGEDLRDVVAGKILSVEAHPNSKKLHHAVVQLHVVHVDADEVPVKNRGVFQCFLVHSKCAPFLWAAHSPAGVSRSFIARPVMSLG